VRPFEHLRRLAPSREVLPRGGFLAAASPPKAGDSAAGARKEKF